MKVFLHYPYSQNCEITHNFQKIHTKIGNDPVGKKVIPLVSLGYLPFYVNRAYPGCLKVKTFLLSAFRFLRHP